MRELVVIVPGRLETRTGGYAYDRRMVAGLRARGWSVDVRELEEGFPRPSAAALDHAARVLAAIQGGTTVLVDGLALGAMPAQIEHEASRLRIAALVHLPLAAEIGIDRAEAERLEASERRALAAAALVIVTGRSTVAALAPYGVASERIVVVEPGTDPAPLARGSQAAAVRPMALGTRPETNAASPRLELLCVATLNAGKGHEILVGALAMIPHRNWHLTCAGSLDRDPATVDRVRAGLRAEGLEESVSLAGELDGAELAACYDAADLFVLATLHETYGMAIAEALAHGLPIVSTTTGAIPELVVPGGHAASLSAGSGEIAGLLVPPGDRQALADALSQLLGDASVRERLARGARRVRDRLPTWEGAFTRMSAALEGIATHG